LKTRNRKWIVLAALLAAILFLGACHKKPKPASAPQAPPPPPPPVPTASLTANPATIQKGESTTLTWETSNAAEVTIEGIGPVQPTGTQGVTPADSTTYHLIAKGPGGTQDATARVTVTQPPPPPAAPAPGEEEQFASNVHDVYFEYDKFDLRSDQAATVQADARWLVAHPGVKLTVEGHCDERGSTEYNLGLGDNRANSVKQALVQAGVAADRIRSISYGKEKPFCTESTESCWQQNRRAHFVYGQ
jgi:peptidoglycan-associated lipoprotein